MNKHLVSYRVQFARIFIFSMFFGWVTESRPLALAAVPLAVKVAAAKAAPATMPFIFKAWAAFKVVAAQATAQVAAASPAVVTGAQAVIGATSAVNAQIATTMAGAAVALKVADACTSSTPAQSTQQSNLASMPGVRVITPPAQTQQAPPIQQSLGNPIRVPYSLPGAPDRMGPKRCPGQHEPGDAIIEPPVIKGVVDCPASRTEEVVAPPKLPGVEGNDEVKLFANATIIAQEIASLLTTLPGPVSKFLAELLNVGHRGVQFELYEKFLAKFDSDRRRRMQWALERNKEATREKVIAELVKNNVQALVSPTGEIILDPWSAGLVGDDDCITQGMIDAGYYWTVETPIQGFSQGPDSARKPFSFKPAPLYTITDESGNVIYEGTTLPTASDPVQQPATTGCGGDAPKIEPVTGCGGPNSQPLEKPVTGCGDNAPKVDPVIACGDNAPKEKEKVGCGSSEPVNTSTVEIAEKGQDASKPDWTPHNHKHFPRKNVPWKETVKSTKHGPAKYKLNKETEIENLEREAWSRGTPTNDGKPHKVTKCDEIIGANSGEETAYVLIESTNNGRTIHGHPITEQEFKDLTKKK